MWIDIRALIAKRETKKNWNFSHYPNSIYKIFDNTSLDAESDNHKYITYHCSNVKESFNI